MTTEEWDRGSLRPLDACGRCNRAFRPGDTFVATIVMLDGGLAREDRCTACGDAANVEGAPTAIALWRGVRGATKGAAQRRLDFDSLFELFQRDRKSVV